MSVVPACRRNKVILFTSKLRSLLPLRKGDQDKFGYQTTDVYQTANQVSVIFSPSTQESVQALNLTSYPARALATHEAEASFQAAAFAITELAVAVALEGRARALATATRVRTCAQIFVVTGHARPVRPRAVTGAWAAPLENMKTRQIESL